MVETLRPDQRLRKNADTKRHDHPEILPAYQSRRTTCTLQAAARRPGAAVEDQRKRLLRTRVVAAIRGGLRRRHRADEHEACTVVHYSGKPQVVPQPRGIPDHRRYHGRDELE